MDAEITSKQVVQRRRGRIGGGVRKFEESCYISEYGEAYFEQSSDLEKIAS